VNTDRPNDEDDQAGENTDTVEVDGLDPLDKGADIPDAGEFVEKEDDSMETGESPMMTFPLLDTEPNTVTSLNTDDWAPNLHKRTVKPKIDFEQLAYEMVVGNLSGHKKAYNSKTYGRLDPTVEINFAPKKRKQKIWKIDSESLQDTLAESTAGWRKPNEALANDFKRNMRTFILPNSHYHGGPTMFKRGLNQYRNQALRKKALDPNPETVEVAVQNARHAFVLNDQVLYGNDNVRLQFKSNFNGNAIVPDSSAAGDIPPPTTWFGVQAMPGMSNASSLRQQGFSRTDDKRSAVGRDVCSQDPNQDAQLDFSSRSAVYTSGRFPSQYGNQAQMSHAPSQWNTGTYATHPTSSTSNYATAQFATAQAPPGATAPQSAGL